VPAEAVLGLLRRHLPPLKAEGSTRVGAAMERSISMKLQGKTKAERVVEIEARKVEREKRRKKARSRQRWQERRSRWRAEGRRLFGGEEGRQRAATAIRAMLARK
jgi:hypothetical protein